jgi:hypothetical protein
MIESKNHRLLTCLFALLLLSAMPMLHALGVPQSAKDDQSIKAIPELVGTRYCYGDAEVYSVWLKLRMKYVNRTRKTLILDKEIGKAWYGEKVARNLDELAAGKYEYNPNMIGSSRVKTNCRTIRTAIHQARILWFWLRVKHSSAKSMTTWLLSTKIQRISQVQLGREFMSCSWNFLLGIIPTRRRRLQNRGENSVSL